MFVILFGLLDCIFARTNHQSNYRYSYLKNVARYFSERFVRIFIDSYAFRTLLSCDRHTYSKGMILAHDINVIFTTFFIIWICIIRLFFYVNGLFDKM